MGVRKEGVAGTCDTRGVVRIDFSPVPTNLEFCIEVQSQLIRMDKYKEARQKNRTASILSHLTLKLNGKASDCIGCATAWSVPELETLASGVFVFGFTMSSGFGSESRMVVCGTCMLDGKAIRFGHSAMVQDKDNIVEGKLLKRMVRVSYQVGATTGSYLLVSDSKFFCSLKNLYEQWVHYPGNNLARPRRILVYRNSGNEGKFKGQCRSFSLLHFWCLDESHR